MSRTHRDYKDGVGYPQEIFLPKNEVSYAVARYVAKCSACVRAKSFNSAKDLPLASIASTQPFQAISIDLYSPGEVLDSGHKYVFTVVDLFSRWVQFIPLTTKLPSEVLSALCRSWFHFHGVPQFILSYRGKEFLGVVSTVCKLLGVQQIKTTPHHPQTNDLCEVQHKTLTTELRIRSSRKYSPSWADLLTEIQFAINVSPDHLDPHLSPFEVVFGRRPRLSAKDITFPHKKRIAPQ